MKFLLWSSFFLVGGISVASAAGNDDTQISFPEAAATAKKRPNIIVILTDDQDHQMESLKYMQGVKEHLIDEGTLFNHHYCTVALCCPSRASMWTGKAAHNTNITDLAPPYGGYPKFIHEGYHQKWLPTWLQKAGYKTYYTGKLMNSHTSENYKMGLEKMSLDGHDFMIEPGTYQYLNTTLQHNDEAPTQHPNSYTTDILAERSLAWIDKAAKEDAPFFLAINPIAPHVNIFPNKTGSPPIPAERHKHLFKGVQVPRDSGNFNPGRPSGGSWVKLLKQLDNDTIIEGDHHYRRRLQALQAVDEMVVKTVDKLKQYNMLDRTYIVYTSDNGFHISQHRLTAGKRCPYEEDINVPLVIRGPGVPKGQKVDYVTSHTDITPTVVRWAGAEPAEGFHFDGVPIPVDEDGNGKQSNEDEMKKSKENWEHVQVEHWGKAKEAFKGGGSGGGDTDKIDLDKKEINTYKALRIVSDKYSLFYSVWCDGDHEVYDMKDDPGQMKNLYNTDNKLLGVSMKSLQSRLDSLLLVLKACKSEECYKPWEHLHPVGNVKSLVDALDKKYDTFYEEKQRKVKFADCAKGYIVSNELPISYLTYGDHSSLKEREAEAWENWYAFTD